MMRIGVIDTGVNPWHSHVRGGVTGLHIYLDGAGRIQEDNDFRDLLGHGTAVAGILRQQLPETQLFVVRVFEQDLISYPSLVARALLRAAAEGCSFINMSLAMPPGPGSEILAAACGDVMAAGCRIIAAGHLRQRDLLPASIPGVYGVIADDRIPIGEIRMGFERQYRYSAPGRPRDLVGLQLKGNLWGNSFACARVTAYIAQQEQLEETLRLNRFSTEAARVFNFTGGQHGTVWVDH